MKPIFSFKGKKKYEFYILHSHVDYMDEKIEKLQNEGWEVCGDVLVKNESGHCLDTNVFIPFRKEI